MKLKIGPSNGLLLKRGIRNLAKQEEIVKSVGSSAFQLQFRYKEYDDSLLSYRLNLGKIPRILHLPKFEEEGIDEMISKVQKFHELNNFDYYLVHPDLITSKENWKKLKDSSLPIAIENMDKGKSSGKEIEELKEIVEEFGFNFVLDIQHSFELDHTMRYSEKLFEELKEKIVFLHVSGENKESNHSLLKDSDNKEELVSFLKKIFSEINVPIILEGGYESSEELREEIEFIKKALIQ